MLGTTGAGAGRLGDASEAALQARSLAAVHRGAWGDKMCAFRLIRHGLFALWIALLACGSVLADEGDRKGDGEKKPPEQIGEKLPEDNGHGGGPTMLDPMVIMYRAFLFDLEQTLLLEQLEESIWFPDYRVFAQPGIEPAPSFAFQAMRGDSATDGSSEPCSVDGTTQTDHPVVIATGNKVLTQTDFDGIGQAAPSLTRYYNRGLPRHGQFGARWGSDHDYFLVFVSADGDNCSIGERFPGSYRCSTTESALTKIVASRPEGLQVPFEKDADSGDWVSAKPESIARIRRVNGKWIFTTEHGGTETYNDAGRLEQREERHGLTWRYGYDQWDRLTDVTYPGGQVIRFYYPETCPYSREGGYRCVHPDRVVDPDGNEYRYVYDHLGALVRVKFPSGPDRVYHYEDQDVHALTGYSFGESRYSVYEYIGSRVKASGLVGGIERIEFNWGHEGGNPEFPYVTMTNAKGATTRYNYQMIDGYPRLRGVVRAGVQSCPGSSAEVVYDDNGYVDYKVDFAGNKSDYQYNAAGQLQSVIFGISENQVEPQRKLVLEWDPDPVKNRIESKKTYVQSPSGEFRLISEVKHFYYPDDAPERGRLRRTEYINHDPEGTVGETRTVSYRYVMHPNHLVAVREIDGPMPGSQDVTRETYNARGELVSLTNGVGHQLRFENHNGLGYPRRLIRASGQVIEIEYDARGRKLAVHEQTDSGVRTTRVTYDHFGNRRTIRWPDGSWVVNDYDAAGRLVQTTRNTNEKIRYAYDELSNLVGVSMMRVEERRTTSPRRPGSPCNQVQSSTPLDDVLWAEYPAVLPDPDEMPGDGVPLSIPIQPIVGEEEIERWLGGAAISVEQPVPIAMQSATGQCGGVQIRYEDVVYYQERWARNALGQVVEHISGDGRRTTYEYDKALRLARTVAPGSLETKYEYNNHGELSKVIGPGGAETEMRYDGLGAIARVTAPNGVVTEFERDGFGDLRKEVSSDRGTTLYEYWPTGNLYRLTRADGSIEEYDYDAVGRLTERRGTGATQVFRYDHCPNGTARLCEAVDGDVSVSFEYKREGLPASQTTRIGGQSFSIGWQYDAAGRVTQLTYPSGNAVRYQYAGPGARLARVDAVIDGVAYTVAEQFGYYPFGPRSTMLYTNSIRLYETRDLGYRLTRKYTVGRAQDLSYRYDECGQLVEITDAIAPRRSQSYSYDALGHLTGMTSQLGNQTWVVDRNGNRLRHQDAQGQDVYRYAPGTGNRLQGIGGVRARGFAYDAAGNTTDISGWGGSRRLEYDTWHRLRRHIGPAGTASYDYDASGLRVRKTTSQGSVLYAYAPGGSLLAETAPGTGFDAAGVTEYVWVDGALAGVIRGGRLHFVLGDHLTRPEKVLNAAQATVWEADNMPFDRKVTNALFGELNLGYPGQYYDAESGYWYNWHRYYDASTGRYLQSDPIGLAGGLNTYAYVGGNPVGLVDPDGRLPQEVVDFFAGIGDGLLLGTGPYIRSAFGIKSVNACSCAYGAGSWISFGVGTARIAYAGLAKAGSVLASSGEAASAFREGLKTCGRFGAGKDWRKPDLSKYLTDEELRKGAGRTNFGVNAYGAGVAGASAIGALRCGC